MLERSNHSSARVGGPPIMERNPLSGSDFFFSNTPGYISPSSHQINCRGTVRKSRACAME